MLIAKQKWIALGLLGAMIASPAAMAGANEYKVYGKFNLSLDYDNTDGSNSGTNVSVSSNSSRLGFKGHHTVNSDTSAVWQLEQEVDLGTGAKTSNTFSTRNSYLGLKTAFGTIQAGIHDTPFKLAGTKWGLFGDTVGDLRAILGASASKHNVMNQRGKNAIMYKNKIAGVKIFLLRATDAMNAADGKVDGGSPTGQQNSLSSGMLQYSLNDLTVTLAAERWDNLKGYDGITGARANAKYKGNGFTVGALFENITADKATGSHLDRNAYGLNGSFKLAGNTLKAEFLSVGDNALGNNTGATKTSVGIDRKLDKNTKLYAVYTVTSNDSNANFQGVDGGHGDELKSGALGASPSAFSLGMVFKF